MPSARLDPFDHAVHTARVWLAGVGDSLATEDRRFAYRVLRAWLHTLRDRLTVEAVVKFGAQLPELLRGVYYEGWEPSRAPVKYGPDEYLRRFASEAQVPVSDVTRLAATVSDEMATRLSPGQLGEVLVQLPAAVRAVVQGTVERTVRTIRAEAEVESPVLSLHDAEKVLAELQARVDNLTEAVRTLAGGFDETPGARGDNGRRIRAARLAAEILLSGQTTGTPKDTSETPGATEPVRPPAKAAPG